MQTLRKTTTGMIVGALAISMLFLFSMPLLAQNQENPQVTQLLADARDEAAQLSRDADEMESLIRTDVSWQTHAAMLETVKRSRQRTGTHRNATRAKARLGIAVAAAGNRPHAAGSQRASREYQRGHQPSQREQGPSA